MNQFSRFLLAVLLTFVSIEPLWAKSTRIWSRFLFKTHSWDKAHLSTYLEVRRKNDGATKELYLFSEQFKYNAHKHLDLGVNYTYLTFNSNDELRYQHRMELEANPKFNITETVKFQMRNRVEFRWVENRGNNNTRLRTRLRFIKTLPDPLGPITSVFADSEFFYDDRQNSYVQNRSIPLGVNMKITDKSSIQTFYMIQAVENSTTGDWTEDNILGFMYVAKF